MSRLLWMVAGFLGGIALARNAAPMPAPVLGAVLLVMVVGCGVCWWAAYRGKSEAVATAVSVAVAQAKAVAAAEAQSRASAMATQAVQIVLGGPAGDVDPRTLWAAERVVEQVQASREAQAVTARQAEVDRQEAVERVGYL